MIVEISYYSPYSGDVILSINGHDVTKYDHASLVKYIQWLETMRIVVVFEDCVRKIELCSRMIKLKVFIIFLFFDQKFSFYLSQILSLLILLLPLTHPRYPL